MEYRRGDIVNVDFGRKNIKGSEQRGDRPALIVQNDIGNKFSSTLIVASITKKNKSLPTHVLIEELFHTSIVACEQIKTIDEKRISKKIGSISEEKMLEVNNALSVSLGLKI